MKSNYVRSLKKITLSLLILVLIPFLNFANEIHVSINGNNLNPGTKEKPLRTIQAAIDIINPGDICIIHNGIYRENVNIKKSGNINSPIIIQAAIGENPIISGLDVLNLKWDKTETAGIYVANYNNKNFEQIFYKEKPLLEARWPNVPKDKSGNWNFFSPDVWSTVDSLGNHYGTIKDKKLVNFKFELKGAKAVLNVCHQFFTWTRIIQDNVIGSDTFSYPKNLGKSIKEKDESSESIAFNDDRYYLVGKKEFLDMPGEWYYDKEAKKLYIYSIDGNIPDIGSLEVKARNFGLLTEENCNFLVIDGITFLGTAFKIGKDFNTRSNNIVFRNNQVYYSSWTDYFSFDGDLSKSNFDKNYPIINADYATVSNNTFAFGTLNALSINGKYDLIENNLFHDFDLHSSLMNPVLEVNKSWLDYVGKGGYAIIRYNTIYNSGGILTQIAQNDNDVYLNDLYNAFRSSWGGNKDASALYTQNVFCHGTRFHHNWVHDSYAGTPPHKWGGGMGIRGDDKTVGLTIDHNVVWNIGSVGIELKTPDNPSPDQINRVFNNTIFNHSIYNPVKSGIIVQTIGKQNRYSLVLNNLSETIYGHWFAKPLDTLGEYSNNYTGVTVESNLEDPINFDFRPNLNAKNIIKKGKIINNITNSEIGTFPNIGAYEYNESVYWIPGKRENKASCPIVSNEVFINKKRDVLMWRPAYGAVAHNVMFGKSVNQLILKEHLIGEKNIFKLPILTAGQKYFWRIDAVLTDGSVVEGDIWSFNTINN
jgi:hypothetical protein